MTTYDLILVGFGNVGRRFAELLEEQRPALKREGVATRIVAAVTRRDGMTSVLDAIAHGKNAARDGRLVLVETTTLDVARGEPATTHARAALAGGAHVITTNKGPAAFAYRALTKAARIADRRFLFEGAVMDGIPVFNLVRETLPGITISGFRGIVNTTTNYILAALEQGQPFAGALRDMQGMGIAEADPSLDLDGWDAAAKTAALANALLDARTTPHEIERAGITADTGGHAIAARASGRRLKLVARASRDRDGVSARVALEELPDDDLLATIDGRQNALVLYTDLAGEIAIVQRGSGLTQTAYALLSDLLTIARARNRSAGFRPRGRATTVERATRRRRPTARRRRSR